MLQIAEPDEYVLVEERSHFESFKVLYNDGHFLLKIITTCPSEIVAPWPRRRKPSSPLPTHCLVGAFQTEVIQAKWKRERKTRIHLICILF